MRFLVASVQFWWAVLKQWNAHNQYIGAKQILEDAKVEAKRAADVERFEWSRYDRANQDAALAGERVRREQLRRGMGL